MGVFKYINKKLKIKTQFILFFIFTTIVSIIISSIVICSVLFISYNKKLSCSNEMYATRNIDKIFDENFKMEIDKQTKGKILIIGYC
ncbi:hypothetical protein [Clostridium senegalense]|uniref:hypothetical protein n=1 Tax=Clostridium senegalense TaxID=1465809 RepID=UPI000288077B|nr:hypothetical protein [Clostridium senegalense]